MYSFHIFDATSLLIIIKSFHVICQISNYLLQCRHYKLHIPSICLQWTNLGANHPWSDPWFSPTCDTLVTVEDTLEPMSWSRSAGVKGVAAEIVPNRGRPGMFRICATDNTLVSLSFECRLCSDNLPKYQPPIPMLVRAVRLNAIRLISFIFLFVILLRGCPS